MAGHGVDDGDIRQLAGAQTADPVRHAAGPGAFYGGHGKHVPGSQRHGIAGGDFLQQRRVLHHLEHILGVVAGRAITGQSDGDPSLAHFQYGGVAGRQDHVRSGVMHHVRAIGGYGFNLGICQVDAVIQHDSFVQHAGVSEELHVAFPGARHHQVVIFRCFCRVQVYTDAGITQRAGIGPVLVGGGPGHQRSDAYPDPVMGAPVLQQCLAARIDLAGRLDKARSELFVAGTTEQQGAYPRLIQGLRCQRIGAVGIARREKDLAHGGIPGLEVLDGPQGHGQGIIPGVHLRHERQLRFGQPLQQGAVGAQGAAQGHAQVGMGIDKTGDDQFVACVDRCGPRYVRAGACSDGRDYAVIDPNIAVCKLRMRGVRGEDGSTLNDSGLHEFMCCRLVLETGDRFQICPRRDSINNSTLR